MGYRVEKRGALLAIDSTRDKRERLSAAADGPGCVKTLDCPARASDGEAGKCGTDESSAPHLRHRSCHQVIVHHKAAADVGDGFRRDVETSLLIGGNRLRVAFVHLHP